MSVSMHLSWILLAGLPTLLIVVHCLDNCLPSREAYTNLTLGPPEDVPLDFSSGIGAQICTVTSLTCCSLQVEQSIDDTAVANVKEKMPQFSLYLNESDRKLFPNYDYVTDVVIEVIRRYFELSVPASANGIRVTLNRITRQLDNIQRSNGGSNFHGRMRALFSYSYLERMRGVYNLSPNDTYASSFVGCAQDIIEQNQISDEITSAIDAMEYQFRSLYYARELFYSIYTVFLHLERKLPFIGCVRSFAELFYCRICLPETASIFPCRNVCKNVLSGCTIFLHVTGEEIIHPLRALCQLNTMTSHPSWNLQAALEVINNELYTIFDISVRDLLQIASNISSCSEAPPLAVAPTPTDNTDRTTVGRVELLSNVSTSLTSSLHNILVTNLSSIFLDFENITQNILESECGSLPEDNGSSDFECWRRRSSSTTDVNFLGINFQAVLFQNQDLLPPSASIISDFNTSVDHMRSNATQAMEFIDNIPTELGVNVDNCNLRLSQILLPVSTVQPTTSVTTVNQSTDPTEYVVTSSTSSIELTTSTGSSGSAGLISPTISTLFPTVVDINRNGGTAIQTGFSTRLLLLPVVILMIILI